MELKWEKLSNITKLQRGKRVVRSELDTSGPYPVYQNSLQPLGFYDNYNCNENLTFIISAGAAGEIGFSKTKFWAADDCYYIECDNNIIRNKYIYYFLLTQQSKFLKQVRKASIPRLGKNIIEMLEIPIPPLSEQQRIVGILDKFDTLTHSITEGLPKEIELRQKQYEYYREQLLNFPTMM